jgi:hypothetical protein
MHADYFYQYEAGEYDASGQQNDENEEKIIPEHGFRVGDVAWQNPELLQNRYNQIPGGKQDRYMTRDLEIVKINKTADEACNGVGYDKWT